MNKALRITSIIVVLVILATSIFVWAFAPKEKPVSTSAKIDTPYESAMKDKKPFVVMFHSQWCSSCHQFMPSFKDLSAEYQGKYNFVLLDIDAPDNKYVVNDYLPASIPMMYIVDPTIDNRILLNSVLFNYPQKLRGELDRYLRVRALIK